MADSNTPVNSPLEPLDSHGSRGVKDVAFGSIAGMASKVFEHPFDLCKVRLQAQVLESAPRFSGPIDCLRQTWKYEGVKGLYRGLTFPVVGAMFENASLFLVYNQLQVVIRQVTGSAPGSDLTLGQKALAAAGGGSVASFFLTPLELIKCKMQVQMMVAETATPTLALAGLSPAGGARIRIDPRTLLGPVALFQASIQTQGLRGLWLGHTGTLLREAGGATAWFTAKEFVGGLLAQRRARAEGRDPAEASGRHLLAWESAASGACAGVAYNLALFPADSVKSALQTEAEMRPRRLTPGQPIPPPGTFIGTFKALYKARGIRGLYAGCGITCARSMPSSAMIFVIYDTLDRHFG